MKPTNVEIVAKTYIQVYRDELSVCELNRDLTLEIIAEDGINKDLKKLLEEWTNRCIALTEIIAEFVESGLV